MLTFSEISTRGQRQEESKEGAQVEGGGVTTRVRYNQSISHCNEIDISNFHMEF